MKKSVVALLTALLFSVLLASSALAQGPSDLQTRLDQEPALRCVAADLNVSNEAVARFKIVTDYVFGYQQNVTAESQWKATWYNRFQFLADVLGVTNPMVPDNMSGAHPNPGCQRLINAQLLLERF